MCSTVVVGTRIVIADTKGGELAHIEAGSPLPTLPADSEPHLVKLMRAGLLLDAMPWPGD